MYNKDIAKNIVEICHEIYQKGLVSGSGGNISYRDGDEILITASGVPLKEVNEDNLVCVSLKNGGYSGNICPSKETMMHVKCYIERPDIKAVLHVHSVYTVAISCMEEISEKKSVPVYTPGYGARVGILPVIPYIMPGSTQLAERVADVIKHRNMVLLENHGVVTVGDTLEQAFGLVDEIEENAKIYVVLNGQGRTLTAKQIDELHIYK